MSIQSIEVIVKFNDVNVDQHSAINRVEQQFAACKEAVIKKMSKSLTLNGVPIPSKTFASKLNSVVGQEFDKLFLLIELIKKKDLKESCAIGIELLTSGLPYLNKVLDCITHLNIVSNYNTDDRLNELEKWGEELTKAQDELNKWADNIVKSIQNNINIKRTIITPV